MKGKNLLSVMELDKGKIGELLSLSDEIRDKVFPQNGRNAVMLFNRPSTRTIVSFEAALFQLGYGSIRLDWVFSQLVRGEAMRDNAKTLGQYSSFIIARLYPHSLLEELAQHAGIPVINAATDLEHPCQALGDLLTIRERGKLEKGNKVVFVGDPASNVANSLLLASTKMGMDFTFLCPEGYHPRKEYVDEAKKHAAVAVSNDINDAVSGAAVVYTNAWIGPAMEEESPRRMKEFIPYQVNAQMLEHAPKDVLVMHPLPAFRGLEISDETLDGRNSVVWQQTRNRLYVQKAMIRKLMD